MDVHEFFDSYLKMQYQVSSHSVLPDALMKNEYEIIPSSYLYYLSRAATFLSFLHLYSLNWY